MFSSQKKSVFEDLKEPVEGVSKLICHVCVNSDSLGCVVITDGDYDARVGLSLAIKSLEQIVSEVGTKALACKADSNLSVSTLNGMIVKYQKPDEVDNIKKIQKDLDEV